MDLYTYLNYTKDYIPIEIIYKEERYRIWDKGTAGEIKEKGLKKNSPNGTCFIPKAMTSTEKTSCRFM